jgi:hypothetical protein
VDSLAENPFEIPSIMRGPFAARRWPAATNTGAPEKGKALSKVHVTSQQVDTILAKQKTRRIAHLEKETLE